MASATAPVSISSARVAPTSRHMKGVAQGLRRTKVWLLLVHLQRRLRVLLRSWRRRSRSHPGSRPRAGVRREGQAHEQQPRAARTAAYQGLADIDKTVAAAALYFIGTPQRASTTRRSRSGGNTSLFQSAPCAS